jgi:Lecithin retinol acyltransferase
MRPGDHICVDRGSYRDHGIYISQEQVIHFSSGPLRESKDSVICNTTLNEFAPGGWNSWVGVVDYRGHPHFSYPEVIERAKSQLGRHGYDPNDRSCERFARWCATGESDSDQAGTPSRWRQGSQNVLARDAGETKRHQPAQPAGTARVMQS